MHCALCIELKQLQLTWVVSWLLWFYLLSDVVEKCAVRHRINWIDMMSPHLLVTLRLVARLVVLRCQFLHVLYA